MTNSTEGLPARAAALDLLHAALSRRAGLDDALMRAPFSALPPRERGHARALVMAALRRLGPIDRMLDSKLQKPPPQMGGKMARPRPRRQPCARTGSTPAGKPSGAPTAPKRSRR